MKNWRQILSWKTSVCDQLQYFPFVGSELAAGGELLHAFFWNNKKDFDTRGYAMYGVRETDDWDTPASIEPFVAVNRWGYVISKRELNFGNEEYIDTRIEMRKLMNVEEFNDWEAIVNAAEDDYVNAEVTELFNGNAEANDKILKQYFEVNHAG
jgi:hypothetical protein